MTQRSSGFGVSSILGIPLLASAVWLVAACGSSQPAAEGPAAPTTPVDVAPAPLEHAALPDTAAVKPAAPTPAAEPAPPQTLWRITEGIATPESVLYDAAADRYLVSNINGSPIDADNNGYITEISGDGKVTKAKLVEGGAKVKLSAPKGMGLVGNVLYVTDINTVRKFDAKTGAPKGEIAVKDATFLNDIAVAPDGRVFVSDSSMKPTEKGADALGGDAVYVIDKAGKVKPLAKSKDLKGPNGLLVVNDGVLVNTFLSDELYRLDAEGAVKDVTKLPTGGLDGLLQVGDSLLVTSWGGEKIYKGKLGGKFEPVLSGLKGPADIGYDSKRNRLIVPRFLDHAVEAYEIK
jgi:sugar lactone lactonase YvrE